MLRAIASIHASSSQPVRVLVVVNGQRFDAALVEELRLREDVDLIQVAEGSQTLAQLIGRRAVTSEFFSFLDDDDEYLPGALDMRLSMLRANPHAAVAVTNGFWSNGVDEQIVLYGRMKQVNDRPLYELFQENWLNSCNHLFRTSAVPVAYFEKPYPFMEWTWIAFQLTMERKAVAASETPTFRINSTPGSLSKSSSFMMSRVVLYCRMLQAQPDKEIKSIIRRRLSTAWHEISEAECLSGNRRGALIAHLRSLIAHWSGIKYFPFSRRLIFGLPLARPA